MNSAELRGHLWETHKRVANKNTKNKDIYKYISIYISIHFTIHYLDKRIVGTGLHQKKNLFKGFYVQLVTQLSLYTLSSSFLPPKCIHFKRRRGIVCFQDLTGGQLGLGSIDWTGQNCFKYVYILKSWIIPVKWTFFFSQSKIKAVPIYC